MFASLDLSNGWMIASRAEMIGLVDDDIALLQSNRHSVEVQNHFRDAMLHAAKTLLEVQCEGRC
jgi:hypothetical protein